MPVTEMRNARTLRAARTIAKALTPAEDTIDASIVENAKLIIAIVNGRIEAGAAAEFVHDAFLSATTSMMSLSNARSQAIECHRRLADVRDALRLDPVDVGCTVTKRPSGEVQLEVAA